MRTLGDYCAGNASKRMCRTPRMSAAKEIWMILAEDAVRQIHDIFDDAKAKGGITNGHVVALNQIATPDYWGQYVPESLPRFC